MAYQPKSYRKFLATSVAAAVVVTAAAPAALAAPADAKFSDVSSSHWAIDDINYLVEKGAIQGYPDGTFKPNNSITRAEIAVVLANTLGLDVDSEVTTDKFSDVPATHWANPYIAAIVDQTEGVIDGYENGTFRPSNTITRQEMAKMVVEAYDLELVEGKDLPFTDVSGLWSTDYINILASNGVAAGMTATTFAPRGEVLRAQTAAFIHRAEVEEERIEVPGLVPTVSSVTAVNATTLTVVLSDDTTHEVTLDTALVANEATEVTFEINDVEYTETVTWVYEELAVASVNAVNGKQLVVNFTQPVDASSVLTSPTASTSTVKTGVLSLNRTSTDTHSNDVVLGVAERAVLSSDGKTLTVTAPTGQFFKGNYDVTVKDAKSGQNTIPSVIKTISVDDTTAPIVNSVVYVPATDKFEVTLSEPIDSLTGEVLRINGQPVASGFDALTGPTNKLTFARPSSVATGTNATIYIAGFSDAAGNFVTPSTTTVPVTQDTTALAVASLEQVTNQKVRLTFNKELNSASKTALESGTGVVVTRPNGSTTSNFTVAQNLTVDNTGKTYDITLSDATYTNGNSEVFGITLIKDAFTDVTNNKNDLYSKSITLNKDTVAPTVTSAALASNRQAIEVTLSEGVTITNPAQVKLRKDGAEQTGLSVALKGGTDNVLVVSYSSGAELAGGSYQVRLEAGAVTDLNGNANNAVNAPSVSVSATPAAPLNVAVANSGTNVFTVTAPTGQTFTTASLNHNNFKIDGQAVSSNSDITLNSTRDIITVSLPSEDSVKISGNALFTTNGLALESGRALATATATVTVTDNTAPTLTGAQLVSANVIKFTFDENLDALTLTDAADLIDDIQLSNGTVAYNGGFASGATSGGDTVVSSVDGKSLVVTVSPNSDSNWATVVNSSQISVTTLDTADTIKDANGVVIRDNVRVNLVK
uniref:Surface layer protein n=1 Tax=Cytobacillus firmus TaxID=1399 RepID=Q9L655_CYTFI|nr:surface layer protein [Cytobacillus firmus]